MSKGLITLKVRNVEGDKPLIMHYSNRDKAHAVYFELKRNGYIVDGLYEATTVLNATPAYALTTADLFFRR